MVTETPSVESILEKTKDIIVKNGAVLESNEEMKMGICYPKEMNYNTNVRTEIFLFERIQNNVSYVLCRNKISEDVFEVVKTNLLLTIIVNQ